ncbi:SusC/RagA family TonB-linked outer membrane protein [Microbacter margulisiae]|uniref:TonB-linked SusC/RagA family outer membrane protein n=1 Tax=Microbacter margulisiae TaxID=1350067 RepID=A0A7W5DV26_9PORP|nr:SusC/RagA family TonB-linked outer membrane protein [Microbacter margulisiae]MBB3188728.1 TonB-linked SusC/RagA family outer membrane protein [Microbacter margulisiae]
MRKVMTLLCLLIGISWASAQTKVTGVVISADDGQPVIGASVVVKGTTQGTITDANGKFSLTVPADNKTLVFSYVGMLKQELEAKPSMRVTMHSNTQQMNEVVVTAFGIKKEQRALGYAASDVSGKALEQAGSTGLSSALDGKVTGVTVTPSSGMPGASSQIVIRGVRSFTGDNTPLYVVDGMPIASTPDVSTAASNGVTGSDYSDRGVDIDPSDIASITVLKGQAAAALYGIRASNGVIVITTKSGQGLAKGKPQITFSTNNAVSTISRYPDLQTMYAQGSYGAYVPTSSQSWGPLISKLPQDAKYGGETSNSYTSKYGMHPGMYYVPQRANAGLDPWTTPHVYNNVKDFFRTGFTTSNMFNVAQALNNTTYAFTLSTMNQTGIVPSTGMNRYTAKGTMETKLDDHWKTGVNANYVQDRILKTTSANDGIVALIYPAPPSYDLKGIPSSYATNPYKENAYRSTASFDDPYWSVKNNLFAETTNRFFGNAYATYSTKWNNNQTLDVKYQLGTDTYSTLYETIWGYGHQGGMGSAEDYMFKRTTINSLLTANYDWKINQDWDFTALAGNEINDETTKSVDAYGQTFNWPGWNNLNNTVTKSNTISQLGNRTVGFFANVSASWKDMLYLNATGREDVVSSMPPHHRNFFYPSLSAGFVVTELPGVRSHTLSYLKLRASYAQVGQAGTYMENYYSVPAYGSDFWSGTPVLYPINGVTAFTPYYVIYDPKLKPQNTKSYEGGFDLKLFGNLIGLNYTFSRQNVTDQIFAVPLAGSTGSQQLITNGGAIHTNTHEVSLSINPIRTTNIEWDNQFNWTKMDNFVDKLAPGVGSIFLGGFTTPQVRAQAGQEFPVIYGVSYQRDSKGNLVVDANGLPMAGAPGVIGKVAPNFTLDYNTTLRLWKVTINAVLSWKDGGQMYGGTNGLLGFYGVGKETLNRSGNIVVKGVHTDGTPNTTAVDLQDYYTAINNIDESSIYNNSFIKLRELSVAYPLLKSGGVTLDLSVYARDILLWTNYPNFDPEASQGNTTMAGAFERFSLPQTSSYGMGLNFKF